MHLPKDKLWRFFTAAYFILAILFAVALLKDIPKLLEVLQKKQPLQPIALELKWFEEKNFWSQVPLPVYFFVAFFAAMWLWFWWEWSICKSEEEKHE